MEETFTRTLLKWFGKGKREMPWKQTKNPYYIWISEVILQQTQVKQGTAYYLKFIELFPTVESLASASEAEVLACWKGLGYYSRARNLHQAAKYIVESCDGIFPNTYDTILKLKGVGPYSAAAIASFAFDLPHAVADGNVYRVLSRVFGIQESIDQMSTKKALAVKANQLLNRKRPADFNQAIMDLGALVCTPRNPLCISCPFQKTCQAKKLGLIKELPKRDPKRLKKSRYFHFLVIQQKDYFLMQERTEKDIWKGLFQFPLIETKSAKQLQPREIEAYLKNNLNQDVSGPISTKMVKTYSQNLTHQKINSTYYGLHLDQILMNIPDEFTLVSRKDIHNIAVPKSIDWYLNDKRITLF